MEEDRRWSYVRPPSNKVKFGERGLAKELRHWHCFDPILVSAPDASGFVPAICLPELSRKLHRGMLLQHKAIMLILAVSIAFIGMLLLFGAGNVVKLRQLLLASAVCFAFFSSDYFLTLRSLKSTQERSMFVTYIYHRPKHVLFPLIALMLACGGIQIFLQADASGLEPLLYEYGLVFSRASDGEYWRFISGPMLHSGWAHWVGNFIALFIAGAVASAIGRRTLVFHFFAYVIVSALAVSALPDSVRPDAFLGLSGGIFGLFGWIGGVSLRTPEDFPERFALFAISFSILSVILSILLSANSSNTAHLVGLGTGLVVGLTKSGLNSHFTAWKLMDRPAPLRKR